MPHTATHRYAGATLEPNAFGQVALEHGTTGTLRPNPEDPTERLVRFQPLAWAGSSLEIYLHPADVVPLEPGPAPEPAPDGLPARLYTVWHGAYEAGNDLAAMYALTLERAPARLAIGRDGLAAYARAEYQGMWATPDGQWFTDAAEAERALGREGRLNLRVIGVGITDVRDAIRRWLALEPAA